MVRMGKDLVVVGGKHCYTSQLSESLFRLSCFNNTCSWEKLKEEMDIPRTIFVAVAIPDDFN